MSGELFVVATPIGNLEDFTFRAVKTLRTVDAILAEDTRRTRILCAQYEIKTPIESFHAHSSEARVDRILDRLESGARFAVVTDAGTPLVSDPGSILVDGAWSRGARVTPIPGPSAVLAALVASGLRADRFCFRGFVPRTSSRRRELMTELSQSKETVILFEAPARIRATLTELKSYLGGHRQIALCRELTKLHEETLRGTPEEVEAMLNDPVRGEIALVIEGETETRKPEPDAESLRTSIHKWHAQGVSSRDIVRKVISDCGLPRRIAYDIVHRTVGKK